MQHKEAIAALIEQLDGLSQDKALGVIGTSEYWVQHQSISKQISKLREDQPSNMYSPEPTPGHFADPFLNLRGKLLNEYNAARAEIRAGGIYDHTGCRVKFVEKELNAIYAKAIGKIDKARNLPVLQRIQSDTAAEVEKAMPIQKAA